MCIYIYIYIYIHTLSCNERHEIKSRGRAPWAAPTRTASCGASRPCRPNDNNIKL